MVVVRPPSRLEFMTDSADTRRQLLDLIDELAVVRGRVTLSSGKEADYYLDLRRVTLDHRSAPLVGDVVLDLLEAHDLLGGLGVSSPTLDSLVAAATAAGARGAKLTGGGLGGCVLALADDDESAEELADALRAAGAPRTWTTEVRPT